MAHRSTSALLVLLIFPVSFLTAQSSVVGRLPRLQDSLAVLSDTSELRALFRASKGDPLRRGATAFRLGELGADPDFSEAMGSFRRASRKGPNRAEAWFALARAQVKRSEWEMRDRLRLGSRVGLGGLERAADQYRQALALDPGHVPAALALAQVELSLLDTTR